jgi:hypothetical protein
LRGVYEDFPRQAKKIRVLVAAELKPVLDEAISSETDRINLMQGAFEDWTKAQRKAGGKAAGSGLIRERKD